MSDLCCRCALPAEHTIIIGAMAQGWCLGCLALFRPDTHARRAIAQKIMEHWSAIPQEQQAVQL